MAKKTELKNSDFNMPRISTGELEKHVKNTLAIDGNIAFFGRRGTGKTEIAKQKIHEAGKIEVYLNMSVLERVDMGGYPNIMSADPNRRFVEFLMPAFYRHMVDGDKKVVALLDEVDKADPSLWAPLLEFTQFHSINGVPLPNLSSVIMTGNLISEGGQRPSPPLMDRTEKYLVEPDAMSWLNWAGVVGNIHPSILSFVKDNVTDLFGAVEPDDRYADASPRGWTRASKIIFAGERLGWSVEEINAKVSGCVGVQAGLKYEHYYSYYRELLPLAKDIYDGKSPEAKFKKLAPNHQLVLMMILLSRLTIDLDKPVAPVGYSGTDYDTYRSKDFKTVFSNIGKFMNIVCLEAPELFVVSMRTQVTFKRIVMHAFAADQDWGPVIKKLNIEAGIKC
jgi:hypothetical protein